jgi:hypothetical protein
MDHSSQVDPYAWIGILNHFLAFIVFFSFSSSGQMWEITRMIIFVPKLVLRSSRRGGTKHQRKVAHDMEQRLKLFQTGQLSQLMAEECHEVCLLF